METNCKTFTPPFHKAENNNSYNRNDKQGKAFLSTAITAIVFILVSLGLIIAYAATKKRTKQSYGILAAFLASALIALGTGIDSAVRLIRNPITLVYSLSYLISSSTRTRPVLDPYLYFEGAKEFETNYQVIYNEITSIKSENLPLTKDTFDDLNAVIGDDVRTENGKEVGWRVMQVSAGDLISANAEEKCPCLVKLVRKHLKQIKSCVVSILPPRTKIPQHVGYHKGFLRYMLAVKVPKDRDNVFLCVNDNKVTWEEGKSIMFDDCFPHKVFNNTDETRIVLYVDIARPIMNPFLRKCNEWIIRKMQDHPVVRKEIQRTERTEQLQKG